MDLLKFDYGKKYGKDIRENGNNNTSLKFFS